MKPIISKKAVKFKQNISPVREIMRYADSEYIKNLGLDPTEIISFAGGWVNHNAPKGLQEAYKEIIENDDLFHYSGGYSPTLGRNECKEAIIKYENHLHNINNLEQNQIAFGASSTQLTFDLLKVLLNPKEKILLLDPSYCNFPTQIIMSMTYTNIIRFPVLDINSWEYIADEKIEEFSNFIIENKPKVILLISPDNPTSKVLSDNFISATLDAAKKIGAFLLIDFAYKEIVFDEKYPKYFSWEPNDNFLSIHSNSKWGRNLGRRLGWVEASAHIIEAMESFLNSTTLSPDTLHQMAFTKYIEKAIRENSLKSYIRETNQKYKTAAKQTVSSIKNHINLPCLVPDGGLYTCIKVNKNSAEFVKDVLHNTGVLFVPGWGFGKTLTNAVRVSYGPLVNNPNIIDKAMEKVGNYLNKYV